MVERALKRRFSINARGELEDRDGYVLGKVVGLTLDVDASWGIKGADVVVEEQQEEELQLQPPSPNDGDPATAVWATYVEAMEPRDPVLHPAERKLILEALKVATVAECQRAIWGCRKSPFHMGDNSQKKKYNRLSHIIKGKRGTRTLREQIDFMLDLADKGGVGDVAHVGSDSAVDPSKLERMKRQVFRAHDLSDSEAAVEQGERAERWLRAHGWVVRRSPDSRPKIERHDS